MVAQVGRNDRVDSYAESLLTAACFMVIYVGVCVFMVELARDAIPLRPTPPSAPPRPLGRDGVHHGAHTVRQPCHTHPALMIVPG